MAGKLYRVLERDSVLESYMSLYFFHPSPIICIIIGMVVNIYEPGLFIFKIFLVFSLEDCENLVISLTNTY